MKITNPTVFLREGELYCLTVEVPKEPSAWELMSPATSTEAGKRSAAIVSAKSSAVKVKNKESIFGDMSLRGELDQLQYNTLWTLTGYEAIIFGLHPNESYAMIATISPVHKEESQEELWKEVAHIVDFTPSNFENVMLENLQSRFTITRKK